MLIKVKTRKCIIYYNSDMQCHRVKGPAYLIPTYNNGRYEAWLENGEYIRTERAT